MSLHSRYLRLIKDLGIERKPFTEITADEQRLLEFSNRFSTESKEHLRWLLTLTSYLGTDQKQFDKLTPLEANVDALRKEVYNYLAGKSLYTQWRAA